LKKINGLIRAARAGVFYYALMFGAIYR